MPLIPFHSNIGGDCKPCVYWTEIKNMIISCSLQSMSTNIGTISDVGRWGDAKVVRDCAIVNGRARRLHGG